MSEMTVERFCPGCGYDLRGIASERCPECGTPFDPNEPTESQIPWSHRHTLGKFKALRRTIRLATFNPKQFATEINRPVSFADAVSFRRIVTWIACAPAMVAAVIGYVEIFRLLDKQWYPEDVAGSVIQWVGLPVAMVSVWLWTYCCTGVASYFFHPKRLPLRQQNRAVAISYYACAPMAYWPLTAGIYVLLILGVAFASDSRDPSILAVALVSVVGMLLIFTHIWLVFRTPSVLLMRTTHCGGGFVLPFVLLLLSWWFLLLLLTVGVINGTYWMLAAMLLSLL
jgi:hypothetical protein